MSMGGRAGERARLLRERALDLYEAAARTSDPDLGQQLRDKARTLRHESEQASLTPAGGTTLEDHDSPPHPADAGSRSLTRGCTGAR